MPHSNRGGHARKLNATSYVVLGMLASYGPATSYELKQRVGMSIGNFWAFAHSQLYDEPARLAADGMVTETVEAAGRRRRTYTITDSGREALRAWLAEPTREQAEVRDLGMLKLFFASQGESNLRQLAIDQRETHQRLADSYAELHAQIAGHVDHWQVKTLELGISYERCLVDFWTDFLADLDADTP